MKISETEKLVKELLQTHNPSCGFEFCTGVSRLGYYNTKKNMIHISREFAKNNSEEFVRDIILHEIAHSLTRFHKHDQVFKAKAYQLGCSAKSNVEYEVVLPPMKYKYTCSKCGHVLFRQRKDYRLACASCCDKYANGKYSAKYIFSISENKENEK